MRKSKDFCRILAVLLVLILILGTTACSTPKILADLPFVRGHDAANDADANPDATEQTPNFRVTSSNIPSDQEQNLADILADMMTTQIDTGETDEAPVYHSPDIYPPFGGDESGRMDNPNEAANALYKIGFDQPEALAAVMAAYPEYVEAVNVDATSMFSIETALESEDGSIVQLVLLQQLQTILEAASTQVAFGYYSGKAQMTYMIKRDETAEATPWNMTLTWENVLLEDEPIFAIAVPREDGSKDFGYFAMRYGFQRVVPIIEWPPLEDAE